MSGSILGFLSRSLQVRFLAALLIGAACVAGFEAWGTYSISQEHIEKQLVQRTRLLASAINHSAMIATTDFELQHVAEAILQDNKDIKSIIVMQKSVTGVVTSASASRTKSKRIAHLVPELATAITTGSFGFHAESNSDLVLMAPLSNALAGGHKGHGSGRHTTANHAPKVTAHNKPAMTGPGTGGAGHGPMAGTMAHSQPGHAAGPSTARDVHGDWITRALDKHEFRGGILLYMDRSDIAATMYSLMTGMAWTSILGIVAMLVLAFGVLRHEVLVPVARLRSVMNLQRQGRREVRAGAQISREFDEVATTFDGMMDAISNHENRIEKLALKDNLTGLANRNGFEQRFTSALDRVVKTSSQAAFLSIDLDHFKNINDTRGHTAGDELLREMARRINASIGKHGIAARVGGDEFAVLLTGNHTPARFEKVCRRIARLASRPLIIDGSSVCAGASIGVSYFPAQADNLTQLMKNADVALRHAKEQSRGDVTIFEDHMRKAQADEQAIEHDLRLAVARKEFFLEYQPQINIRSTKISGAEALVRWAHPDRGRVPPDLFIATAEKCGMIVPIGEWVLRTACAQAKKWQDAGLAKFVVGVNVSPVQLRDTGFVALVGQVLEDTGLAAKWLELELTESGIMDSAADVTQIMQQLSDLGVRLAIDDFGTGHSSLSRLRNFPVDRLKIDRSFVARIKPDSDDAAITGAIVNLAKIMHMEVIAEGVETAGQLEFLASLDCHEAQGYLIAKPLGVAGFEDWYTGTHAPAVAARALNRARSKTAARRPAKPRKTKATAKPAVQSLAG